MRCAVCGQAEWTVGVAYPDDHIVFFCPRCVPEEFRMVKKELPIDTPTSLRRSWVALHRAGCPYTRDERDRAERRMYARAKQLGVRLPEGRRA